MHDSLSQTVKKLKNASESSIIDEYICPQGERLRHTTTDKNGKRTYRSPPKNRKNCPCKAKCGANEKWQKMLTTHIWQEYLDIVEQLRKTKHGKEIYAKREETIERVFADVKEKHAMRYTHHRGMAAVTRWVRLKYAAMNLIKMAIWEWEHFLFHFTHKDTKPLFSAIENRGYLTFCEAARKCGFNLLKDSI